MTLTTTPSEIVTRAEASGSPGLLARHETWERVPLRKVADILNGAPFSSRLFNKTGRGLPLIRIRDIGRNSSETWYDGPYEAQYLVQSGDILVGMDGDFRIAQWRGSKGLLNQRVCKISIRDPDFYNDRFLVYLLQGYLDAIWAETSSVTVKHLSSRSVGDIPLPLPPIAEQHRIVQVLEDHLSRLNAGVASVDSARERTKRFYRILVDQAVRGRLWTSDSAEPRGDQFLAEILQKRASLVSKRRAKATPPNTDIVSALPPHWGIASVDQLSWNIEYGTSAKTDASISGNKVPVLRMGNIQEGKIQMDSLKYLPESHPGVHSLMLSDGDLLFNRTNSAELVGKSAVYRESSGPATFASYLIRCRMVAGVEPDWVNTVINSTLGRTYVASVMVQQVGQANVNGSKLGAMPIPLPPPAEQQHLLQILSEWRVGIERLSGEIVLADTKSRGLRQALLAEAFAGRLVPQDPNDEHASALLERIRTKGVSIESKRRMSRTSKKATQKETLL
ncbi:restriction endonuclease subunit S [Herbidospora sp. RD11066]